MFLSLQHLNNGIANEPRYADIMLIGNLCKPIICFLVYAHADSLLKFAGPALGICHFVSRTCGILLERNLSRIESRYNIVMYYASLINSNFLKTRCELCHPISHLLVGLENKLKDLAIFCADVGSIKRKQFGWAAILADGFEPEGTSIEEFAVSIANEIRLGAKVTLGFECPLFVPVRSDPVYVNAARNGEGNRSWSASRGASALATGIVEVLWVMNEVSKILRRNPAAEFQWKEFVESDSVFLWEAFVTATTKGRSHTDDARIAVYAQAICGSRHL